MENIQVPNKVSVNQEDSNDKAFVEETSRSMYYNVYVFILLLTAIGIVFMFYGFKTNRDRVKHHIV